MARTSSTKTQSSSITKLKRPSEYRRLWNVLPHPEGSVVRLFSRRGDQRDGDFAESPRDIRRFADAHSEGNIYIAPNPTNFRGGTRHSAKHVTHWSYFLVDVDPVEDDYDANAALWKALTYLGEWAGKDLTKRLPLIIDSGRGMQAWVRLEDIVLDPSVDRKAGIVDGRIHPKTAARVNSHWLKKLNDRLKVIHGCQVDTSCSDLPRVMRCPGTYNQKTGRKARIINCTDVVYDGLAYLLSTIDEKYLDEPESDVEIEKGQKWQMVYHHLTRTAQQYLTSGWVEPGRHKTANHTARTLLEKGCTKAETWKALKHANKLAGEEEALPLDQLKGCLTSALEA